MSRRGRGDDGQATVEVAIVLPFLVVLLLAMAQVGLVIRAQVMVIHAAREAARAVAVDSGADATEAALLASTLDPSRTAVDVSGSLEPGGHVTVTVNYSVVPSVPLAGAIVGAVDLDASATMLVEGFGAGESGSSDDSTSDDSTSTDGGSDG